MKERVQDGLAAHQWLYPWIVAQVEYAPLPPRSVVAQPFPLHNRQSTKKAVAVISQVVVLVGDIVRGLGIARGLGRLLLFGALAAVAALAALASWSV